MPTLNHSFILWHVYCYLVFQEECEGEVTPVETGLTMETTSFQGGSPVPSNPSPHAHSLRQDYERWNIGSLDRFALTIASYLSGEVRNVIER